MSVNYKSKLQELCRKQGLKDPVYETKKSSDGSQNNAKWVCKLTVGRKVVSGNDTFKTKKAAEANRAETAYRRMTDSDNTTEEKKSNSKTNWIAGLLNKEESKKAAKKVKKTTNKKKASPKTKKGRKGGRSKIRDDSATVLDELCEEYDIDDADYTYNNVGASWSGQLKLQDVVFTTTYDYESMQEVQEELLERALLYMENVFKPYYKSHPDLLAAMQEDCSDEESGEE